MRYRLLCLAQGRRAPLAINHQHLCLGIGHLLEGDQLRVRPPCEHQRAPKPVYSIAVLHLPQSGLAGREYRRLCAAQPELCGLAVVRMPSWLSPERRALAPARASPERSSGFSPSGKGGVSVPKLTGQGASAATWSLRKNRWVATSKASVPWSPLSPRR